MGQISDELWELIRPLMPSGAGRRGRPFTRDHRLLLEGIAWRFRTGCPWRDVPAEFGSWKTLWKRHQRFGVDGTYRRMLEAVCAAYEVDAGDCGIERLLSIDSTVVRAHQHSAGAPKTPGRVMAVCAPDTGG
jgi:transposase